METRENLPMEELQEKEEKVNQEAMKNTLFSSLVFVGGGIVAFILLLIIVYMVRL